MTLAFLVPPFEAPDENGHLGYASFLATRGELPNQLDPDPARRVDGQGHQPPLAYAVMAGVLRVLGSDGALTTRLRVNPTHAWHGGPGGEQHPLFRHDAPLFTAEQARAFYALRLLSVVYGVLTLVVVARFMTLVTDDEPTRVLAVLLAATLPQLVFVTSYATADALLILLSTVTALQLARAVATPERWQPWVLLGVALAGALLVKKTALFLMPGIALVVGAMVLARRLPLGACLRGGALVAAVVVVVAGWLFVRNHVVYGDPLGSAMEQRTLQTLMVPRPLSDPYFREDLPRLLGASFVGVLGWMNVWLPAPVYWLYGGLAVIAAAGVLRRLREPWTLVALTFAGLCLLGIVVFNMTFPQPQGRYLFAALPFLAYLAAAGLRTWMRRPWPAIAALAVALVLVDVTTVVTVIRFFG